ncbi:hypothetical protein [Pseudomonas aeruginosa]|uniref:hypothetical protein n=2 Tax=Pseudomonas aeruginosa TaxID=287 RepID=UPI001969300A|nr:hypothetical protein [Pseudomonas aeruginosa]
MSMELNKALELLREIRPSIPKDVLELWCKDRDAFLAQRSEFHQHLKECADEVATWPTYKREALGPFLGHELGIEGETETANELNKAPVEQAGGDERDFQAKGAQEVPSPVSKEYDRHLISLLRKGEALPGHQEEAADEIERLRDWNDHLNNTVLPNILNPNFLMLMKGGERLLDLCTKDGEFIGVSLNDMKDVFDWMVTHARIAPDQAALAQPSPAQAEQAEVVAWRYGFSGGIVSDKACLDEWKSGGEYQSLMTVAQHERIVGALRFERQQMDRAFTACINERDAANARLHEVATACATAEQERDAALARVAELERVLRVVVNAADHGSWPTTVMHGIEKVREVIAGSAPPVKAQPEETPGEILAAKLIETWVTKHGKPAPWSTAVEITALATNMPNDERDRLLALDDDVDAQAQHSVPELDQLYSMLGAESQVDAAKKIAELIGCRMSRSALTEAQMRRIYENSTEIENERLGFAAFARLMRRAEAVHQIAAAPGKEGL